MRTDPAERSRQPPLWPGRRPPARPAQPPPFPDLEFVGEEGGAVRLSELKGNVVLLNVWATWCGPCKLELPIVQKMYDTYSDRNFVVVSVNVDADRASRRALPEAVQHLPARLLRLPRGRWPAHGHGHPLDLHPRTRIARSSTGRSVTPPSGRSAGRKWSKSTQAPQVIPRPVPGVTIQRRLSHEDPRRSFSLSSAPSPAPPRPAPSCGRRYGGTQRLRGLPRRRPFRRRAGPILYFGYRLDIADDLNYGGRIGYNFTQSLRGRVRVRAHGHEPPGPTLSRETFPTSISRTSRSSTSWGT